MPIQTNLDVSPYFDDTTPVKDFYRVLFKPGVAVQARELNSLQAILQTQIERFGDNIFKAGTIIDGCHMSFNTIPFVKVKDNQGDGSPVNVTEFNGLYVKNSSNLQAVVVTTVAGFESRNPDLNTLYVRYINSGTSATATAFNYDETLTVFDPTNPVFAITANNGSTGFNKADSVVIVPAIAIQNSSGGTTFPTAFTVGDTIRNGVYANGIITSIDTTTNSQVVILGVKPLTTDLALQQANSAKWSFSSGDTIVDANTTATAQVVGVIGSGATASLVTGAVGQITDVAMVTTGSGYYVNPYVTVASTTANTLQINTANLAAQNYLTTLVVGNSYVSATGSGYAMGVDDGVIYQKGYFSRVSKQLVVVSKYSTTPDQIVVGFNTNESLINSNIDSTLLDNASNTYNYAAPGADRLKLTPSLVVMSKADSLNNTDFMPIAEFSQGQPYIQNQQTQYNVIGDYMAQRMYDEAGNFVLDQFLLSSKSPANIADETTKTNVLIDPGKAYINGYLVQTLYNDTISINKGIDTVVAGGTSTNPAATVTLNYGNYVLVNQVGGQFNFTTGGYVSLYNKAVQYVTSGFDTNITTSTPTAGGGVLIGTARIRNFQLESGVAGTASAVYRLYLFDINMNAGQNFRNVRSVYLDGTNDGIADIVLTADPTTGTNIAQLNTQAPSRLLFYAGRDALKNANTISYQYRTSVNTATVNTQGYATVTVSGADQFPATGALDISGRTPLVLVPTSSAKAAANAAGSVAITSSGTGVTGTSTSFTSSFASGDFVIVANATVSAVQQIASITNATAMNFVANPSQTIASGNIALYFPKNVPIDLVTRSGRMANVSSDGKTLTVGLGTAINATMSAALTFNVNTSVATATAKTSKRGNYIRLRLANNAAGLNGPWCLGIPDVYRLRGVYLGSNATFSPTDTGVTDVTNQFFVDHNQQDSYYGISYLQKKATTSIALTSSNYLLIKVDAFATATDGVKTVTSYVANPQLSDGANLTSLTAGSNVHTLEIPELWDKTGNYYDLRDCFDFRPVASNTVGYVTTAASAPLNPVEPAIGSKFSANDKKFPIPGSILTSTIEYYVGRADRVYMDITNNFQIANGTPGATQLVTNVDGTTSPQYKAPPQPNNAMTISTLSIPPYPSLAVALSNDMAEIADTKTFSTGKPSVRLSKYQITPLYTSNDISQAQPKGYTMSDIGKLERRIQNLEYYVSLSLAEADVNNRIIPSGTTGLDRYKFGYMVDSFTDTAYADQSTTATIYGGRLQAKTMELTIEHKPDTGQYESLPFNSYPVITQTRATNGPLIEQVTETVQTIQDEYVAAKTNTASMDGSLYEEIEYKMSATSGQAVFYFNMLNLMGAVEVYYGNQPGFSTVGMTPKYTAKNLQDLTLSDNNVLSPYNSYFGYLNGLSLYQYQTQFPNTKPSNTTWTQIAGKWVFNGIGKMVWTHNPNDGQYVKIRVTKFQIDNWWFGLYGYYYGYWNYYYYRYLPGVYGYPIYQMIATYPSDTVETFSVNLTAQLSQFNYTGTLLTLDPPTFTMNTFNPIFVPYYGWYYWYYYGGQWYSPYYGHFADNQIFNIVFAGLKPSTKHTFTFNGQDLSAKCRPLATDATGPVSYNIGDPLVSDKHGMLSLAFYYDAGINEATSDWTAANRLMNLAVGAKTFTVQSADGSSVGQGTINIKQYVTDSINTVTNVNGVNK